DGEVHARKPQGRPRPYQDTMRRFGRTHGVDVHADALPLSLFCFDCLYAAGQDLIDRPTAERAERLAGLVPPELVVTRTVTSSIAEAERFLAATPQTGHEGGMARALDAPYDPR